MRFLAAGDADRPEGGVELKVFEDIGEAGADTGSVYGETDARAGDGGELAGDVLNDAGDGDEVSVERDAFGVLVDELRVLGPAHGDGVEGTLDEVAAGDDQSGVVVFLADVGTYHVGGWVACHWIGPMEMGLRC